MMYVRGPSHDFDHWRQLGNVGWGYDDVLPFFKKAEDNERGADKYHSTGGPLSVSNTARHELADAFIEAAAAAGYPKNSDLNGATQEGFGYNQLTVRNGERCSTARGYLHPARKRPNLHVITHALASRILFKGREAVGVEFRKDGAVQSVMARREVIVSSGAINSPKLLQMSGVGSPALLKKFDIPVVADLPGVGENLQDHFGVALTYRLNKPVTLNDYYGNPLRRIKMGLEYFLMRKGPMAANAGLCQGFIRSEPHRDYPDLTVLMWIWSVAASGKRSSEKVNLNPYPGITVMVVNPHPESRGSVRIKSSDVSVPPEIRFNHLVSMRDRQLLIKGFRDVRRIMSMPPIASYVIDEEDPGSNCTSDDQILDHIRKRGRSTHHTTATCRMGVDKEAIVDPRLRVNGLGRLRVIDASIMPSEISGNTNAATIMIAEKGAQMVLEDAGGNSAEQDSSPKMRRAG